MKLVDANVLIYAVNEDAEYHVIAKRWLDRALVSSESIGLTWIVMLAFVRLTTRHGLFPRPLTNEQAIGRLRTWLGQPAAVAIEPTARHLDVLASLLIDVGSGGNIVSDAHLAAIATEHHAEVVTFDSDFSRFAGVRWTVPGRDPGFRR